MTARYNIMYKYTIDYDRDADLKSKLRLQLIHQGDLSENDEIRHTKAEKLSERHKREINSDEIVTFALNEENDLMILIFLFLVLCSMLVFYYFYLCLCQYS